MQDRRHVLYLFSIYCFYCCFFRDIRLTNCFLTFTYGIRTIHTLIKTSISDQRYVTLLRKKLFAEKGEREKKHPETCYKTPNIKSNTSAMFSLKNDEY